MQTVVDRRTCRHSILRITSSSPTEFIDLTDRVSALITDMGLDNGLVHVQTRHTTTAVVVNEHEPLLLADFAALLSSIAPRDADYRHDDMRTRTVNLAPGERANGHAHCRALLLGGSVMLNVAGGALQLGRWQRLFFVELDGAREREVSILLLGDGLP
jgi:secondary thiamine-phosphate synthase enzyme